MKQNSLLSLLFLALVSIALGSCKPRADNNTVADSTTTNIATTESPVDHGKYLAMLGGCGDCHTPLKMGANGPEPDMAKLLSGSPEGMIMKPAKLEMPWMATASATMTAWGGPWGISYAKNLTPDSTGIGNWDEATFMLAMRNGKHMGNGRPIMPPMPWQEIGKLTDNDLKAIFAYLKSIPAVRNTPPEFMPAGGPPPGGMPPAGTAQPPGTAPPPTMHNGTAKH